MSTIIQYTLNEKVVILDKLQGRGSCSMREAAQGLGVPFAVATKVWQERQLIRRSWSESIRTTPSGKGPKTSISRLQTLHPKRVSRTPKQLPEVEAGVLGWYQEVMTAGGYQGIETAAGS